MYCTERKSFCPLKDGLATAKNEWVVASLCCTAYGVQVSYVRSIVAAHKDAHPIFFPLIYEH
jgi:hypothetical protein